MAAPPLSFVLTGPVITLFGALLVWQAFVGSAISCGGCSLPLWPLAVLLVGLIILVLGLTLRFKSRSTVRPSKVNGKRSVEP